jgi:hypothetical protein
MPVISACRSAIETSIRSSVKLTGTNIAVAPVAFNEAGAPAQAALLRRISGRQLGF